MVRLFTALMCVLLFCSFVAGDPMLGKWSACGTAAIGDARIELQKKYLFPCAGDGYRWTEMKFDTAKGGRMEIGWCVTSPVPVTPGTMTYLSSTCSSRLGKWSYDATTSTLTITDGATVQYTVASLTDSSMVLIKK